MTQISASINTEKEWERDKDGVKSEIDTRVG